jgi:hypothetical protein
LRAVEDANTARVKQIVKQYGFPTKELIGTDGVNWMNTLVLHAIHDPTFQTEYLAMVKRAVESKQLPGVEFAYLTDKILLNAGKPQVYGTQPLRDDKGNIEPYPIEDIANVDKRRAELGMEPLEEYLNIIRKLTNEQRERIYKEDVTALLKEFIEARKNYDAEKLSRLLSVDYVEISLLGELDSREKVLNNFTLNRKPKSASVDIDTNDPEETTIRIYGDVAIVTTRKSVVVKDAKRQVKRAFWCMFVCRKNEGKWQLVSAQFTETKRTPAKS